MAEEPVDTHEELEQDDEDEDDYESTSRDATNQEQNFKNLSKDAASFFEQVSELNDRAATKIRQQKHKEAVQILQQAERMLEFAASCGRAIDRNLIIVVLYNQACAFQCQWVLDKCSKYLDGVIYNMELSLEEEVGAKECSSLVVKRYAFLARCYLQFCAILSQLGKHASALENARKAAQMMRQLFKVAYEFCGDYKMRIEGSANSSQNSGHVQKFSQKHSSQKDNSESTVSGDSQRKYQFNDEVTFAKLVVEKGFDMLKDMAQQRAMEDMSMNEKEQFNEAKKQLYYWRNNPENNEKHFRKELKVGQQCEKDDFRSLLGIQNVQEWIESFNIGSIMHMVALNYEEFSSYGEMIYEISKRVLLEKIIYLSISYFTIATEFRFVEIEKAKQGGLDDKDIHTEEFKISELYHLKAIEIACKYITCSSPYINHLITSYHKHYNSNLDTIQEESFHSQTDNQSEVQLRQDRLSKLKKTQQEASTVQISEAKLRNLEKSNIAYEQILSSQQILSSTKQLSSPTSKLLHSFMNQQPPSIKSNSESKTKAQNVVLEQMLRPSGSQKGTMGLLQKQQQYFYQQQILQHSPNNSTQKAKRDSSPTIRNNTVPALTFLQNAMLYNQQQKDIQQLVKEKQNASATNASLENSLLNNLIKKDANISLTIQPQRNACLNSKPSGQIQGQSKTSKSSLNTLLATQRQPAPSTKTEIISQIGYLSHRQPAQNLTYADQCRTERSRELIEPRIQSQQNSRSPERNPQLQRLQNKPSTQPRVPTKTRPGAKDMTIPIRLETIQQLLKNNKSLMNYTKQKMK